VSRVHNGYRQQVIDRFVIARDTNITYSHVDVNILTRPTSRSM